MGVSLFRRKETKAAPPMDRFPDALCVDPHTGAVVGFWIDAGACFPSDWGWRLGDDFVTVPTPSWLLDYAGAPFHRPVPEPLP